MTQCQFHRQYGTRKNFRLLKIFNYEKTKNYNDTVLEIDGLKALGQNFWSLRVKTLIFLVKIIANFWLKSILSQN